MKRLTLAAALAVSALLTSTSLASAANLVTNGDFTSGLNGWVKNSGQVNATDEAPYIANAGGSGSTPYSFAAFGWGDIKGGTIAQTLATVIGQTYTLSFDFGGFGNPGGNAQTLAYSVGDLINFVTASSQMTTSFNNIFQTYTFSFEALSTSSTLSFADISGNTASADGLLTNVSVQAVPGPEAGAGLAGLAMAGFGAYAIRRRRQIAA